MGERVVRAGFAVELTLRNFSFARAPFSGWLLRAPPAVTAALSVATWWAEIAALPLLLCPLAPLLAWAFRPSSHSILLRHLLSWSPWPKPQKPST